MILQYPILFTTDKPFKSQFSPVQTDHLNYWFIKGFRCLCWGGQFGRISTKI